MKRCRGNPCHRRQIGRIEFQAEFRSRNSGAKTGVSRPIFPTANDRIRPTADIVPLMDFFSHRASARGKFPRNLRIPPRRTAPKNHRRERQQETLKARRQCRLKHLANALSFNLQMPIDLEELSSTFALNNSVVRFGPLADVGLAPTTDFAGFDIEVIFAHEFDVSGKMKWHLPVR